MVAGRVRPGTRQSRGDNANDLNATRVVRTASSDVGRRLNQRFVVNLASRLAVAGQTHSARVSDWPDTGAQVWARCNPEAVAHFLLMAPASGFRFLRGTWNLRIHGLTAPVMTYIKQTNDHLSLQARKGRRVLKQED